MTQTAVETDICTWGCYKPTEWLATLPCCGYVHRWCGYHHDGLMAKYVPGAPDRARCAHCEGRPSLGEIVWNRVS